MAKSDESENAVEFVNNFLGDLEEKFRARFGNRWTPEVQSVYQSLEDAALRSARACDCHAESQRAYTLITNSVVGRRA